MALLAVHLLEQRAYGVASPGRSDERAHEAVVECPDLAGNRCGQRRPGLDTGAHDTQANDVVLEHEFAAVPAAARVGVVAG